MGMERAVYSTQVFSKYNLSVVVRVEAVVAGGSGGYEEGCVHKCSANTAILENWFQILCGRGSGYGKYIQWPFTNKLTAATTNKQASQIFINIWLQKLVRNGNPTFLFENHIKFQEQRSSTHWTLRQETQ